MRVVERFRRFKAKMKGMTPEEYAEHQRALRAKRLEEQKRYELWKVEQEYQQKRQRVVKSGGSGGFLSKFGAYAQGVNENLMRQFGYPTHSGRAKKRKRKKRRR